MNVAEAATRGRELRDGAITRPLEHVTLSPTAPTTQRLTVTDALGRTYVDQSAGGPTDFVVGGTQGWQTARLLDATDTAVEIHRFQVVAETTINDGTHGYGDLLRQLRFTLRAASANDGQNTILLDGKLYHFFYRWLRDHTHALKAMKYFEGDLRSGVDLYAERQRADGMLFERISLKPDIQGWRDYAFAPGGFIRQLQPGSPVSYSLQRIPVENDVEYLFIECLYRTWQATGDTAWMATRLDHAKRAVAYSTTDPHRWSEKFKLLKRPFTIDTWDFLHQDDGALTLGDNVFDSDHTTFGVMHGDNTGMAMACRFLADMLDAADRPDEAPHYRQLADELLHRLDELAWDDRGHYLHHVTENPGFVRDVGDTDETVQVSLSNAYALNRGIDPEKARAIVATYRRIREEMPEGSPGEWYLLYPPFEQGFQGHNGKWQYMNGGVSTIVAGELARGAFAIGDNAYAADILQRLRGLSQEYGGYLPVCLHGNPKKPPPPRTFTPINLDALANLNAKHDGTQGWAEPTNDLSQMPTGDVEYHGIPFTVLDHGRGVAVAQDRPGFSPQARVPIDQHFASMYLLHTASAPAKPTVELELVYTDGQTRRVFLNRGEHLDNWFMPGSAEGLPEPVTRKKVAKGWPEYQIAWQGPNATFDNVGVFVWGWDNPRPDVEVSELVIRAANPRSAYFLPGITLCDVPVWFPPRAVSWGIPDGWGAAAVVYALIEGLAGVADTSKAFESVAVSPRWSHTGVDDVEVCVAYPESGGYVAYRMRSDTTTKTVELTLTGSGDQTELVWPVDSPLGCVASITLDGIPTDWSVEADAHAGYARLPLQGVGPHHLTIAHA